MYQEVDKQQTDKSPNRRTNNKKPSLQLIIRGMDKLEQKQHPICNVLSGDTCRCVYDSSLAMATFNDEFEVKNAQSTVRDDRDPKVKGEVNFELVVPRKNYLDKGDSASFDWDEYLYDKNPKPVPYKGEKVVVIIDTGLDIRAFHEKEFNLFDTTAFNHEITDCDHEEHGRQSLSTPNYGWNFIDDSLDLKDKNLHGTLITKNLLESLSSTGIKDFQVLPLKVFDDEGSGSFWSIVQAFAYLKKLKEWDNSLDIAVINASFGILQDDKESFDFTERAMLKSYIDYFKESSVIVTPAGNEKNNNDFRPHFPSNFASSKTYPQGASSNLLAVAGHTRSRFAELSDGSGKTSDMGSNFGQKSVHIAAPWEYRIKLKDSMISLNVEGTSYSASYISARLLDYLMASGTDKRGSSLLEEFLCDKHNGLLEIDELLPLKDGVFIS